MQTGRIALEDAKIVFSRETVTPAAIPAEMREAPARALGLHPHCPMPFCAHPKE